MVMTALNDLWHGFGVAFEPHNLMWCFIGVLFGNFLAAAIRNPAAAASQQGMLFLGMALTEALGIFALVMAFIILFV